MHRESLAAAQTEWSRLQATGGDDGRSKGVDGMLHTVAMLAAEDEKLNSELASWSELEAIMGALSPLAEVLIKAQVSVKTKDSAVALSVLITFSQMTALIEVFACTSGCHQGWSVKDSRSSTSDCRCLQQIA